MKSIQQTRESYRDFILSCKKEDGFTFSKNSESSPYALCFAIFGLHLIRDIHSINTHKDLWIEMIISNLELMKFKKLDKELIKDKPYLQLLTFSLSALFILDRFQANKLSEHVKPLLNYDFQELLSSHGVAQGNPGSGNMAMFWAILLLHGKNELGIDTNSKILSWVDFHIKNVNKLGFWNSKQKIFHGSFQNSYHQVEILEYLDIKNIPWKEMANAMLKLADRSGNFAPYPGGGGCYDYDAVAIITNRHTVFTQEFIDLLNLTYTTLINSQNSDGGFGESSKFIPRNIRSSINFLNHIMSSPNPLTFIERARKFLVLQRSKHKVIHTHWTKYSRGWNESDLWDSWFRMLAIARIEIAINKSKFSDWGFIDYPGIGYHHYFSNN